MGRTMWGITDINPNEKQFSALLKELSMLITYQVNLFENKY